MRVLGRCGIDIGLIAVAGCCASEVLVFVVLHAKFAFRDQVELTLRCVDCHITRADQCRSAEVGSYLIVLLHRTVNVHQRTSISNALSATRM